MHLLPGRENWLVGQDIVIRLEETWEDARETCCKQESSEVARGS